jgi:hypothetical protein
MGRDGAGRRAHGLVDALSFSAIATFSPRSGTANVFVRVSFALSHGIERVRQLDGSRNSQIDLFAVGAYPHPVTGHF